MSWQKHIITYTFCFLGFFLGEEPTSLGIFGVRTGGWGAELFILASLMLAEAAEAMETRDVIAGVLSVGSFLILTGEMTGVWILVAS